MHIAAGTGPRRPSCDRFAVGKPGSHTPRQVRDVSRVGSLGQQALAVIHRPDLPVDGKAAYFRQPLRQDFDLTAISRFVLGPYSRVASPGERQEFADLLTQRLIDVYVGAWRRRGTGNLS
jgi:hypothetical protein